MPEKYLANRIVGTELTNARTNMEQDISDFDQAVLLIEGFRDRKDYDWMSNITYPKMATHQLVRQAFDASRYFKDRDYVEIYQQEEDVTENAEAWKELINKTLNRRDLHFFPKYLRAHAIKDLYKNFTVRCWWERETVSRKTGVDSVPDGTFFGEEEVDTFEDIIVKDGFQFDVIDPRMVYTDDSYSYSLQDKKFVTIQYEQTLNELKAEQDLMNYINLDKLDFQSPETEHHRETTDTEAFLGPDDGMDIFERHGKDWAVVTERDDLGFPTEATIGYGGDGTVKDKAEFIEMIIGFARGGSDPVMIRYQPQTYRDGDGKPYRPLIRCLGYMHPTTDGGWNTAMIMKDLQNAIDDTINISNDRVKLATIPQFIGNPFGLEDNQELDMRPGGLIEVQNKDDLRELVISSDITGMLRQMRVLLDGAEDLDAISEVTAGGSPELASTTATSTVASEQNTSTRMHLRSLMSEFTFLQEFYWMIVQMTGQFADIKTAQKLLGDKLTAFDPDDYVFLKPVTASIESDYSKGNKINQLIQLAGIFGQFGHPSTAEVVNTLVDGIAELMGDDMKTKFGKFTEGQPMQATGANAEAQPTAGAVNETGLPDTGVQ